MNYLVDRFPDAVRVNGTIYPVNADFRVGLRIMCAFEDKRLTDWEKQIVMCSLLYRDSQPEDFTPIHETTPVPKLGADKASEPQPKGKKPARQPDRDDSAE